MFMKDNCYCLHDYSSSHKWHESQNKYGNKRRRKGFGKQKKLAAKVNDVEGKNCELNKSDTTQAQIFTPEQDTNLKFLGSNNLNDSAEHVVNITGTVLPGCTTDWIIDIILLFFFT